MTHMCLYLAVSALGAIIHSEEAGLITVSKTPENTLHVTSWWQTEMTHYVTDKPAEHLV